MLPAVRRLRVLVVVEMWRAPGAAKAQRPRGLGLQVGRREVRGFNPPAS